MTIINVNSVSGISSVISQDGNAVRFFNSSGTETLGAISVSSLNGDQLAGTRNRIINGGMSIDQRNAGASQTFTAAAALAYSVDRWYGYCTGANVTGQRVQGATANQHRYQFTGAASVTGIGFGQRIEAVNSADMAGTRVTLGVDLANSLLTSVNWTLFYANTTDTFGTLASPTRTQIATGTFTVNSTVTRYSTSINIPAAATTGLEILFTVGSQTSGSWTIGNVQLEEGSIATPFERRSFGQELALCQRYYWQGYHSVYSQGALTTNVMMVNYPVHMRAAPTATWTPTFTTNLFSFTVNDMKTTGARSTLSSTSGGSAEWTGTIALAAEI